MYSHSIWKTLEKHHNKFKLMVLETELEILYKYYLKYQNFSCRTRVLH